eukprot:gene22884-43285_t
MPFCTVELRVGGRYRYIWQNVETGARFGSYGEHLEIVHLKSIVTSEVMDGLGLDETINDEPAWGEGDPAINTLTLSEADGKTTLCLNMLFPSQDIRDMAVQSGMSDGMAMGYDRLDAMSRFLDGVWRRRSIAYFAAGAAAETAAGAAAAVAGAA